MQFLPWWIGAPAMALATVGYFLFVQRTMGVSGSVSRAIDWQARANDKVAADLAEHPDEMRAAMLAATLEEFGPEAAAKVAAESPPVPASKEIVLPRLPWSAHVTFVAFIFVGGLVGALAMGKFSIHKDLGESFGHLVASGWNVWPTLAVGGVLVGFGTRMAGGCTTGHGLSGCARMQPGSLIATGIFMGVAIAVSFALALVTRS